MSDENSPRKNPMKHPREEISDEVSPRKNGWEKMCEEQISEKKSLRTNSDENSPRKKPNKIFSDPDLGYNTYKTYKNL